MSEDQYNRIYNKNQNINEKRNIERPNSTSNTSDYSNSKDTTNPDSNKYKNALRETPNNNTARFKKNLFGTSKRFYQEPAKQDPKAKYLKLREELYQSNLLSDNVEDVDDVNKLYRPVEKCTRDGKRQTVNKLIANPGSTIRPLKSNFINQDDDDLSHINNYQASNLNSNITNNNQYTQLPNKNQTPQSIEKLNREYESLKCLSDDRSTITNNNDMNINLDDKLAYIDNVIASCQGAISLNPFSRNNAKPNNPNNSKHKVDHDLNDELSDVDEFELTKSYNGGGHTSASYFNVNKEVEVEVVGDSYNPLEQLERLDKIYQESYKYMQNYDNYDPITGSYTNEEGNKDRDKDRDRVDVDLDFKNDNCEITSSRNYKNELNSNFQIPKPYIKPNPKENSKNKRIANYNIPQPQISKKSVQFAPENIVFNVDCEYPSKKTIVDDHLRDDLSDDEFEHEECEDADSDTEDDQKIIQEGATGQMKNFFNTSNKNFFKLDNNEDTDQFDYLNQHNINPKYVNNINDYNNNEVNCEKEDDNVLSEDEDECGKSQHDYRNDQRNAIYKNYNFIGSEDRYTENQSQENYINNQNKEKVKTNFNNVLYSPKSPRLQIFDENTDFQLNISKNQNYNQLNKTNNSNNNDNIYNTQFNNDVDNYINKQRTFTNFKHNEPVYSTSNIHEINPNKRPNPFDNNSNNSNNINNNYVKPNINSHNINIPSDHNLNNNFNPPSYHNLDEDFTLFDKQLNNNLLTSHDIIHQTNQTIKPNLQSDKPIFNNQEEPASNDYFNQLFNSLQQTKEDLKSLNIDVDCNEIYNEREKVQLKENVTIRANPSRRIGFNNNIPSNVCLNSNQYAHPQAHAYTPVQPLFEHKIEDNIKYSNINGNNGNVNMVTQVNNGVNKINTMSGCVNVNKNAQNISNLKSNIAEIMNELKSMKNRNGGYL
eukprot:Mrub_00505.p1 GENE.Mrub_00505~~Mrub_00505.p1  ORF type:complete len:1043 (+),score=243.94 Mrub_00505:323-3130(+)